MTIHSTSKGRITIPAELRRKYGIRPDTKILIKEDGFSITLTPITNQYLQKLQGSFSGLGLLELLLEQN